MTGLVVLDVFIGLVFIYLLYSLLATLLVEIISTNLGFRARNLKLMIIRMLSDEKFTFKKTFKSFWSKGVSKDSLAGQFYDSPLIKYLNSGSYFSKPSSISPEMFVSGLLSIIGKGDKSLAENIKDYFSSDSAQAQSGDTYEQLKFYFKDSNNDVEKFKERLKGWFIEMGERSQGWYKKRIQLVLLIVGLVIATLFNVDTFGVVHKLSQDQKAREYFVQAASQIDFTSSDSVQFREKTDNLKVNALDSLFDQSFKTREVLSLSRCKKQTANACACKECGVWEKYWYSSFSNFLGCLLSAFAISLGAPFWYDLLSKLMQLRASVATRKFEEKPKKKEPNDLKG